MSEIKKNTYHSILNHFKQRFFRNLFILSLVMFHFFAQTLFPIKAFAQDTIPNLNKNKTAIILSSTENQIIVSGRVVSTETGKSLEDVRISFYINNNHYSEHTDKHGVFKIKINLKELSLPITTNIYFSSNYYYNFTKKDVEISNSNNLVIETIQLEERLFIGDPNYHRTTTIKRTNL